MQSLFTKFVDLFQSPEKFYQKLVLDLDFLGQVLEAVVEEQVFKSYIQVERDYAGKIIKALGYHYKNGLQQGYELKWDLLSVSIGDVLPILAAIADDDDDDEFESLEDQEVF